MQNRHCKSSLRIIRFPRSLRIEIFLKLSSRFSQSRNVQSYCYRDGNELVQSILFYNYIVYLKYKKLFLNSHRILFISSLKSDRVLYYLKKIMLN